MSSNKYFLYICIFILSVFFSSISQILLKLSARKKHKSFLSEYLNTQVVLAYTIFFSCTLVSLYALKVVPLSLAPILEATGFIFVAVLSRVVLKEGISRKKMFGLSLIIVGVIVCTL